jgi:ribonucleoside-diphosphate reductase alpha chain
MVGNTTGGCEPIYNVAYYKNVSDDVQGDEMLVEFDDYFLRVLEANDIDVEAVKREAQEQMAENEFQGVDGLSTVPDAIGELFVTTGDLSAKEHAGVQTACQTGVDSAISKCLEEGTLVATDSGVRPIESFADETPEPDEFVDVDEDVTIDGVPVESQYYAGETDATRIRVDNGTELVGATASHRVLTPDGWTVLGDLEEGDYVIGRHAESHGEGGGEIAFTRQSDVATDGGAAVATGVADPSVFEKDVTLPSRMSPRLARFLGMYAADGSAIDARYSIEISTSSERVRDEAHDLFEELFDRTPTIEEDTRGDEKRDTVYGVALNSRPVWEFVTDLCGAGSYEKEVPREILRGSPEEKLAFADGVTLDGHVTGQSLVVYGGMSETLADGVAELLRSFGVPKVYVGRKWVDESDAYAYEVHATNEIQELVTPIEPHKRVERFDQRHRVYVPQDRVDKTEFDSRSQEYYAARNFEYRDRNYMFDTTAERLGITDAPPLYRVTDVEDAGTREMYDVELAGPHEYVVGGVVSHNTVNAPNDSTVEDAKEVFEWVYDHGGKGVTYYRDGTRSKQVLTTRAQNTEFADESEAAEALIEQIEEVFGGIEAFVESEAVQAAIDRQVEEILGTVDNREEFAQKQDRPDVLHGVTQRIDTGYGKLYVNINEDPEADRPFELFANIGNSGGFTASFTEALAKTISTALRAGVDPWEIAEELQGIRSPKVAWDKGEQIQSIPDAIGTAMIRYLDGDVERAYPQQQTLRETAEETERPPGGGPDDGTAPEPDATEPEPDGGAVGARASAEAGDQDALVDAGESPECPECGALSLYYSEGCKTCESCGWSEC